MPTLVIFDGFNAAWRLAHSLPELTTPKGQPIQLVYGFLRLVRSCIHELEADDAIICWEEGRSKLRKRLDPEYKANRESKNDPAKQRQRDSVFNQVGLLKKTLSRMAVAQVSNDDQELEADDYAAACCLLHHYDRRVIVSNDRDYLQLVSPGVEVYTPSFKPEGNFLYKADNFEHKMDGLSPAEFLECRLLTGDTSDNIQGIRNLGPVTAAKLLAGSQMRAEAVFHPGAIKNFREVGNKRMIKVFDINDPDFARKRIALNRKLMDLTLYRKSCLPAVQEALAEVAPADSLKVFHIFREFQFDSLLSNFPTWVRPFLALGKIR